MADGGVAKSDIARSSIHRWEGGTSEAALKVGVQHDGVVMIDVLGQKVSRTYRVELWLRKIAWRRRV
jgi:hypothetical protein